MIDIYGLDEPSSHWRQAAAALSAEVLAAHAADVDAQARFPQEGMAALAQGGFYGLCVDKSYGGQSQGPASFAAVVEESARHCASTAMVYIMPVTAAKVIETSATFSKRAEILRTISEGKHLTTLAFSEQGSRSQFWAPISKLEANGAAYRTDAMKSWVTAARHADSYVSSAQSPDAQSPLQSTLYWLPRARAGWVMAPTVDHLADFLGRALTGLPLF